MVKRTWIVEEVLAQNLVFQSSKNLVRRETMYMTRDNFWNHGDQCCKSDDLHHVHSDFNLNLSKAFKRPARLDYIATNMDRSYSILKGMAVFCRQGVTDPRDRIYDMLGFG